MVAATDGTAEQVLLTDPMTGGYGSAPSWSPDGRLIAYVSPPAQNAPGRLTVVDVSSREKRVVPTSDDLQLGSPVWSSDQRSLLLVYSSRKDLSRRQIGAVSYPDGAFRTITNDTNSYSVFRVSADGRSLVSIVSRATTTIAVRSASADPSSPPTPVIESRETISGFLWTDDGSILYARGNQLRQRAADGRERIVFEGGAESALAAPEICRGSGQIIFMRLLPGATAWNLWRINADGGELFQLTNLPHAQGARCSHDGQWVAFTSATGLARVPAGGGPVEPLDASVIVSNTAWSPDSRSIAAVSAVSSGGGVRSRIVIVTPGAPTRHLDAPGGAGDIAFTPDGSAVSYLARKGGTLSRFIQPLDGSAPSVTTAPGDALGARVSPDGSQVALRRTQVDSDVVLLRDGAAPGR
jgi:Tol biopolymer transport system component